jgi:hypothetical protein
LTVTNAFGTSSGSTYTFANTPTLTSISPSSGFWFGGNVVTLTGTNLTGATEVRFGATNANSFTVVSDTTITVTVPPGPPLIGGLVAVTAITAAGTSNGLNYSYNFGP